MKKLAVIIALMLMSAMTFTGCLGDGPSEELTGENRTALGGYTETDENEIKAPVINWWKIYKDNNKTNCVTVEVSNPNSFPIGFSFFLTYYKNNEVVKSESLWAVTCVEPNKPGIIYGDIDIPPASDVDRVELEIVDVSRFANKVISGTFKESFADSGKQYFDVSFPEKPRSTEIWVALYNDTNGNKKIEADEFVQMGLLAPFVGIYDTKGEIHIPLPDGSLNYTDYQIYCLAYTLDSAK